MKLEFDYFAKMMGLMKKEFGILDLMIELNTLKQKNDQGIGDIRSGLNKSKTCQIQGLF